MMRVLLIDDDVELCELLGQYLRREGIGSDAVHDGESGVKRALEGDYAALILDVMLPGLSGLDVLRAVRAELSVPILMLTARGEEIDRVVGLEMGADDYLPKPFSSRELVARLRAILRRAQNQNRAPQSNRGKLRVGEVCLHAATRETWCGAQKIELTGAEFDLLTLLLQSAGAIVSREAIAQKVMGRPLSAFDRSIDVHISNLRRKLGPDDAGGERIKTVRGAGYLYALPDESVANDAPFEAAPE